MKRRRNLLLVLLLISALSIGVGYAAVSGTLNINANVEVDKTEFEVVFTNAVMTATAKTSARQATLEGACSTGFTTNTDTVNPTFGGLQEAGDTVAITYTVTNNSNVEVELTDLAFITDLTAEQKDYINVEVDTLAGTLISGASKDVTVTVTLKKVSETDLTSTFVLKAETKVLNDVTP